MIVRSDCRLYLALAALALSSVVDAADLTVKGIKAKKVDCYTDGELQNAEKPEIQKDQWPGPLKVQRESEDGVYLTVNGRSCWIDRSQLILEVPDAKDCRTQRQLGSRGFDEECKPAKKASRR